MTKKRAFELNIGHKRPDNAKNREDDRRAAAIDKKTMADRKALEEARSTKESRALAAKLRTHYTTKYLKQAEQEKKEKTMKEEFAPIGDMISLVANQQPGEATVIVNDLLSNRVLDALSTHKQDIAKSLFAPGASPLAESEQLDEKNWIKGAIKHPGALHKALGVPQGEKIPAGKLDKAAHEKGKVGKEARLAKTLKSLHESDELVQEEHESVEDFVKRGGKVKQVPAGKAHGSQKKQTMKVPFRMGKAAR